MEISYFGKWLAGLGLFLVVLGVFFWMADKIPFWERLPGDIKIEDKDFKFYFPLVSCLLLSVVGSLILWVLSKLK